MPKITDTNYHLPIYTPIQYYHKLSSGRTEPLLVRCANTENTSERKDIVLKLSDGVMSHDAKCRELIASFIAKELDIHVPEPVLIHLSQESLLIFEGTDVHNRVEMALTLGYSFGSEWAGDGYNEFVKNVYLPFELLSQAFSIFVFDVLIGNADRRIEKQNLKTYQNDVIIFDHESAFGFVFDPFPNKTPSIIPASDKVWIQKHLLYEVLKKNGYFGESDIFKEQNIFVEQNILTDTISDFDSTPQKNYTQDLDTILQKIRSLDNNFWEKIQSHVPVDWQQGHEQVSKIESYISQITYNIPIFRQQIIALFS